MYARTSATWFRRSFKNYQSTMGSVSAVNHPAYSRLGHRGRRGAVGEVILALHPPTPLLFGS
jgi:hypothetical protein